MEIWKRFKQRLARIGEVLAVGLIGGVAYAAGSFAVLLTLPVVIALGMWMAAMMMEWDKTHCDAKDSVCLYQKQVRDEAAQYLEVGKKAGCGLSDKPCFARANGKEY